MNTITIEIHEIPHTFDVMDWTLDSTTISLNCDDIQISIDIAYVTEINGIEMNDIEAVINMLRELDI